MIKKLFSHTLLYGIAPQIPKLASFFVLPIITKDLTSVDYGVAGLISAYTAALSIFQSLGIHLNLANSFYKYPSQYKWFWRQLHGFNSLWSIIYGFIVGIVLYSVMPEEVGDNTFTVILLNVLPSAFFSTSNIVTFRYYQMSQKPFPVAIRTLINGFIAVFLNLFFISILKMGYMGWFWSSFLSNLIGFTIFFYPIYFKAKLTPIFNFKWRTIKKSLKVSLPTIPHYYSNYLLNTSDKVVLDALKVSTSKIGFYNFASNFGNYFSTLGDAIGLASGPIFNKCYKEAKKDPSKLLDARNLIFFMQAAFLLFTFLVCLWLREIFYILVNNLDLRESYPLAIIIIMAYNYRPMYLGMSTMIFYEERTKNVWKISFIAGLSNVIMNFILVPIYGVQAAAIVTFISLMYMGYSGYFLKEYKDLRKLNYYPLLWLLGTILNLFIVFTLRDVEPMIKIIITLILLILIIVALQKNKKVITKSL